MLDTLKDRFHKAKNDLELASLQDEAFQYSSSYPGYYHLLKSHWLRENNKRAKILGLVNFILPTDSGFRPLSVESPLPSENISIKSISGDRLMSINGLNPIVAI